MRLIDADALGKKIHDWATDEWNAELLPYWVKDDLEDMIDNAPTVDPIKHGHWDNKIIDARFDVPHTVARCSNCKGKIWVYAENYEVKYPYCPLCGAKMDEVTDG